MNSQDDVEKLEKLIGQLQGLYQEISLLAKKSPNDGVNDFKLSLINKVIELGNEVLGEKYKPFMEFDSSNRGDVLSTSDITLIISQYIEQAERYRSDNVKFEMGRWVYVINGEASEIPSGPPSKVTRR